VFSTNSRSCCHLVCESIVNEESFFVAFLDASSLLNDHIHMFGSSGMRLISSMARTLVAIGHN
jgi:hypothetical protein